MLLLAGNPRVLAQDAAPAAPAVVVESSSAEASPPAETSSSEPSATETPPAEASAVEVSSSTSPTEPATERPAETPAQTPGPDGAPPSAASPLPPGAVPGGETPPAIGPDGKPLAKPGGAKPKPAGPEPVKRSNKPPEPADPKELDVRPDAEGKVQFQFRNQPWPDLLKWLAEVSDLSLDWQELPGDYLNLSTHRPFSLVEARDVINRHLLARGYTLLEHEGVLSVVKTAGINPALVPRVRTDELSEQPPHRFVRTSVELSFLVASEVADEFKSMLSPNGKLTALDATNRLELMDAAANLRDIAAVIEQEQSSAALDGLAREFPLKHARAESVKTQLESFLGMKSSAQPQSRRRGGGGDMMEQMQMQMQMQQQMQQMQMEMQQAGGNPQARKKSGARNDEVYVVANTRNNSLIVSAAPHKMAVAAAFIQRIDVPSQASSDFQRMQSRMKVYRLASLDPKQLVAALVDMDALEPTTRLQVDEDNSAIIAYASIADQFVIQSVIDRLDGSGRKFEVLQLRRLDAESVAGSIQFLMGAQEEKADQRNSYRPWYMFDGMGSGEDDKGKDKMRVGANVRDNQVMLWANAVEMEEVRNLLIKLGELPPEGGNRSTIRVIDASRQPETLEYLKRLQQQWNRTSPNPLLIPEAKEFEDKSSKQPSSDQPKGEQPSGDQPSSESAPGTQPSQETEPALPKSDKADVTRTSEKRPEAQFVSTPHEPPVSPQEPAAATASLAATGTNSTANEIASQASPSLVPAIGTGVGADQFPAIVIELDAGGNLVLRSEDTAALDRLEELMQADKPPRKPYDIFRVKYARASWIVLNLQDYFKSDEKQDDSRDRLLSFIFDLPPSKSKKTPERQLGKKRELKFLADNDTSTIIVQGADDRDRKTIQELIDLWDVPEPVNSNGVRFTKLVRVQYSSAESVAEAIKDAYRDLLSANDKAFQQQSGPPGSGASNESKRNADSSDVVSSSGGVNFAFKGKLSVGVDKITNSILVSAEGQPLLELVCEMIQELDEAAKPQGSMKIVQLSGNTKMKSMQKALQAILQRQSNDPQQAGRGRAGQTGMNPGMNSGEAGQAVAPMGDGSQ